MSLVARLRGRFPRLYPVVALGLALGTVGGVAAFERRAHAEESCCKEGSACCKPGAACCKGHRHDTTLTAR